MIINYSFRLEEDMVKRTRFIALFIYAIIFTDLLRIISTILNSTSLANAVEPLRNFIYVFIFAGYYYYSTKKAKRIGIVAIMVYFLILLFSIIVNPGLQSFAFTLSLLFISRYLLAFVMISQLEDPELLISIITKFSWIVPIYVLTYAFAPKDLSIGYAYNMTFSYNLLFPSAACFYSLYVNKKHLFLCILVDVFAIIGVVLYGSRGTILCVGVSVIYIIFANKKENSTKKYVGRLILAMISFFIIIEKDLIVSKLASLFPNSRSLFILQNGNYLWDSNRDEYRQIANKYLHDNPFDFMGLAGDTFVYGKAFGETAELGRHSHNMFIELLVSYGVIIGGIICIYILYRVFRTLLIAKHKEEVMSLCSIFLVPMLPYIMISGSVCQSYQYWLLIGATFNLFTKKTKSLL